MALGRILKLKVGRFSLGNEAVEGFRDLSELDIEIDITRSVRFWENCAEITVYNASPETIKYLMSDGVSIIVEAGHEGEKVGVIYSGQIAKVRSTRENADIKTVIVCTSSRGAYYQLAKLSCDVVLPKTTTYREGLEKLCAWAGIVLCGAKSSLLDTELGRPFVFSGSFNACLQAFGLRTLEIGLNIYFDNNELILVGKGKDGGWNEVSLERIDLNFENGLISAAEIRDESVNEIQGGGEPYFMLTGSERGEALIKKYNIKEPEKAAVSIDRLRRVNFSAFISPIFAPNVFVNLDSRTGDSYDSALAITGRFLILETNFRGDNMGGDFSVFCECLEAK